MTEDAKDKSSDRERCIRWRKIAIDQLGYTLNLVFTLTIAAVGYTFALLRDKEFNPGPYAKCATILSLSLSALSAASGFFCIFNRLVDIHGTARRACDHPDAPSKDELRGLGKLTWRLFYTALVSFALGVLTLAVALLLTYGGKLR